MQGVTLGSMFFCCVPVPERNTKQSKINGKLCTQEELRRIFTNTGFEFEIIPDKNGALLYFRAKKK